MDIVLVTQRYKLIGEPVVAAFKFRRRDTAPVDVLNTVQKTFELEHDHPFHRTAPGCDEVMTIDDRGVLENKLNTADIFEGFVHLHLKWWCRFGNENTILKIPVGLRRNFDGIGGFGWQSGRSQD